MKTSYLDRAKKFVRKFVDWCVDPAYIFSSVTRLCKWVDGFNKEFNRKVEIASGVSRAVLMTSDYVVKVDIRQDSGFGNCSSEVAMYRKAVEDGYGYLFAEATLYEYAGLQFEICPRYKGIGERAHKYKCIADLLEFDDEVYYLDDNISDLHDGNFSWTADQGVKLIDYASNVTLDNYRGW